MTDIDPRCENCGHKRSEHHYRHPFAGPSQADTVAALAAERDKLAGPAVKVKPLVWRSEGDGWRHAGQPEGKGFANFCLWAWKDPKDDSWRFSNRPERHTILEAAKAAAQAEYEARILSALDLTATEDAP